MKYFKIIIFLLLSVCSTINTFSQSSVFFQFGTSIPKSDFASDNIMDQGDAGAAVGFNFGLQYVYRLPETRLGLFGGVDFHFNGLQKDFKERRGYFISPSSEYSRYINIPLTTGFRFIIKDDVKVILFVDAGMALNYLKITNMKLGHVTVEMDAANNLGFKIGGGILMNRRVYLSVNYLGLGSHELRGSVRNILHSDDLNIDLLTLTLGLKF